MGETNTKHFEVFNKEQAGGQPGFDRNSYRRAVRKASLLGFLTVLFSTHPLQPFLAMFTNFRMGSAMGSRPWQTPAHVLRRHDVSVGGRASLTAPEGRDLRG